MVWADHSSELNAFQGLKHRHVVAEALLVVEHFRVVGLVAHHISKVNEVDSLIEQPAAL